MHQSIATIDSPEFINLQPLDINPLMSKCEIKVLYLGENRNHSYITKDVANEMAKSLRGAPIVGYYKEENEDFADHGEQVIIDGDGVKFKKLTKPYGFVAPDAQVWFQKFEDTDDFGNKIQREYLMTTGYLWTGQYSECQSVIEDGKGQSMELDEQSLDGHWETDRKNGMEFFIINDATFSKLCILGDDVEPCFEGASISKPEVSASFSKVDDTFKKTLYAMMQDLKFALEGGSEMELENEEVVQETPVVEEEEVKVEPEVTEPVVEEEPEASNEEPAAAEEELPKEPDSTEPSEPEEEIEEEVVSDNSEEDYSLLKADYEKLQADYSLLKESYDELVEFKNKVEDKEKEELIKSFYMLSDEDKKDVIENKSKYSKDEIESKLSVICYRKKVNFDSSDLDKNENKEEEVITTYSVVDNGASIPAWISAVMDTKKNKKD